AEREAVMLAVHREQEEIRKWVEATASASADRADVITRKRVTQTATVAERLLDRAASYGAALLAIAGFLGVLFGAWFRLIHRRIEKITVINHHDQTSETQLLDQSTVNRGRRNAA
ncbi:MAG: hypothetical protein VX970_05385, partial [Planctomycetota bacterium]|nr:hypothetical protein [Planctomycetota bacterium]